MIPPSIFPNNRKPYDQTFNSLPDLPRPLSYFVKHINSFHWSGRCFSITRPPAGKVGALPLSYARTHFNILFPKDLLHPEVYMETLDIYHHNLYSLVLMSCLLPFHLSYPYLLELVAVHGFEPRSLDYRSSALPG